MDCKSKQCLSNIKSQKIEGKVDAPLFVALGDVGLADCVCLYALRTPAPSKNRRPRATRSGDGPVAP